MPREPLPGIAFGVRRMLISAGGVHTWAWRVFDAETGEVLSHYPWSESEGLDFAKDLCRRGLEARLRARQRAEWTALCDQAVNAQFCAPGKACTPVRVSYLCDLIAELRNALIACQSALEEGRS